MRWQRRKTQTMHCREDGSGCCIEWKGGRLKERVCEWRKGGGGNVRKQTYHPRSPPVNSGGQTISLIEFNPASPQEAPRPAAPLCMERLGGGDAYLAMRWGGEGFSWSDKGARKTGKKAQRSTVKWVQEQTTGRKGRWEWGRREPAVLLHDYTENVICIVEWNPNTARRHCKHGYSTNLDFQVWRVRNVPVPLEWQGVWVLRVLFTNPAYHIPDNKTMLGPARKQRKEVGEETGHDRPDLASVKHGSAHGFPSK